MDIKQTIKLGIHSALGKLQTVTGGLFISNKSYQERRIEQINVPTVAQAIRKLLVLSCNDTDVFRRCLRKLQIATDVSVLTDSSVFASGLPELNKDIDLKLSALLLDSYRQSLVGSLTQKRRRMYR